MRKIGFLLLGLLFFAACDDGVQKSYWENGNLKSRLVHVHRRVDEQGQLQG